LTYGGIFGGIMLVFPILAALFGNGPPLGEIALAGSFIVLIWGTLGFLAGFSSQNEPTCGTVHDACRVSVTKRLIYRFVAGLLLGYIATCVVIGIVFGSYALATSDFLSATPPNLTRAQVQMLFVGFCGFLGAEAGAFAGCWLGAMLAPGGNQLKPIAKRALSSALLGALGGGWLGGLVGFSTWLANPLARNPLQTNETVFIGLAAAVGALAGIAAAIGLRALR
jgi:hypothetical protein